MGGSGHCQIVTSLGQDVTVDVLTAKCCQNSNCTFRMIIKLSSLFDRINKDDLNYSYWQIVSLVCPLKNHVTVFSIRVNPKAAAKMAGIMNKVYCIQNLINKL